MVELTRHAQARMQQRGITSFTLSALFAHGAITHDHRGATIVYFDKKARARLRLESNAVYQRLEKKLSAYAVVGREGTVLTVGHRNRRIRRP